MDDAFITVASAITSFTEDHYTDEATREELIEKAKNVGKKLFGFSVKIATLGLIKESDFEDFESIRSDFAKGASNAVGEMIEERLRSHTKDIALIEEFKELLSSLPESINQDGTKPLIIIVDELDRCKPSFAVDMLEKIKHLFSVKNVMFVLVMNKQQLEESVRAIYGANIDANTYLQKFINIETQLPKKIATNQISTVKVYSSYIFQQHGIETWGNDRNIIDCVDVLAEHFNLSLRQLERVYTNISVFYASTEKGYLHLHAIITLLSVIKVIDTNLFHLLATKQIDFASVCNKLNFNKDTFSESSLLERLVSWIEYALMTDEEFGLVAEDNDFRRIDIDLSLKYGMDRQDILPYHAEKISLLKINSQE
uniref:KAP NTPase domain-containing protein n=1 Tax=Magnetococcus massalia (strain MO-1) TaxID=451514 RepID=A0A1S7LJL8_MAGMO|nr:Protein of unknown function [Candidatus Magnetococcus massalia]